LLLRTVNGPRLVAGPIRVSTSHQPPANHED
jgi:hypothetical protein